MQTLQNHEVPVYARLGVEIVSGDGVHVETATGERWIDFYGGHAVALLGYRHPRLLEVLRTQAERLFFQTNVVDVAVRQAAHTALAELAPDGLDRVFLVNSGAEANENALRVAFVHHKKRTKVVCLAGGFHGRTAAAGACTAGALGKWYGFPNTPFDVVTVPVEDHPALWDAVDEDTAAVILEPIQGIAGCVDLSPAYLQAVREVCTASGALFIADEVQCGMGRSGDPFAVSGAGVVPDMITTAKGLAGGFPAGALILPSALAEGLKVGALGTTFGGGPMACALISAIVAELQTPALLANVRARSEQIRATCQVGPVVGVQGRGLLLGLRTNRPVAQLLPALRERGILAGGSSDPFVLRLTPPLILEASHVDALAAALADLPEDPYAALS